MWCLIQKPKEDISNPTDNIAFGDSEENTMSYFFIVMAKTLDKKQL